MSVIAALAVAVSGLHGVVMRGPTQPVCRVGIPCSAPAVGAVLVFSHAGRAVARVRVGSGGRYSVRLGPGTYTVRQPGAVTIGTGLRPAAVRVVRGLSRRVDFSIDTGIR
ncbi:MAG TPA: hypothetical protein VKC62_06155 [Gaiellaceae bacterium]|nr:hypothetical protein [Gaiellaceae bacterium]